MTDKDPAEEAARISVTLTEKETGLNLEHDRDMLESFYMDGVKWTRENEVTPLQDEIERLRLNPQGLEGILPTHTLVSLREYRRLLEEASKKEIRERERKAFEAARFIVTDTGGINGIDTHNTVRAYYKTFEDYERAERKKADE